MTTRVQARTCNEKNPAITSICWADSGIARESVSAEYNSAVLLNGWKEIATYLRCGPRTVQRWEALGMPLMRVRPGKRGPVVTRTEDLDAWVSRQSLKNKGRFRADIQASVERAASVRARATDLLRVLLENELRMGMAMADRGLRAKGAKSVDRYTAMARQAHDIIKRLALRTKLSGVHSAQFEKDLERLKGSLRKLGEDL
jgi:hypothetical protein